MARPFQLSCSQEGRANYRSDLMNVERIEAILRLLQRQSHIGEVAVEGEDWKLRARRIRGLLPAPPVELAASDEAATASERYVIQAGGVGIYRAPKKPMRAGEFVAAEAVVGNIETMGILNAVTALEAGYLVNTLIEDGDAVEYGQEPFVLEPSLPADLDSRPN